MKKIILIDDRPEIQQSLIDELVILLEHHEFKSEIWNLDNLLDKYKSYCVSNNEASNADEDVWCRVLSADKNIVAVVIDRDLSGFGALRISESAMVDACKQASIPVCTYHRQPGVRTESQSLRKIVSQTRSFAIAVDISEPKIAAQEIINVAEGFSWLKNSFQSRKAEIDELPDRSPAAVLSFLLAHHGLVRFFSKYASGPTLASDIIGKAEDLKDPAVPDTVLNERLPFVLGCWLYNYILPFPGVLLNQEAAAAYVNLSLEDFTNHSDLFESAKYSGPFSGTTRYWWRFSLDQILIDADCEDGVQFLKLQEIENPKPSVCCKTNQTPTGFYCLINKKPISIQASTGSFSWVPQGADLCRIETDLYERIAPIMGL